MTRIKYIIPLLLSSCASVEKCHDVSIPVIYCDDDGLNCRTYVICEQNPRTRLNDRN